MITYDLENLNAEELPLYKKYPAQTNPQEAYVHLDEDGVVTADYDPEVGGAVTADIWHGRTLRFSVSPYVRGDELKQFLESEKTRAMLEKIHEHHEVYWNGNNYVGRLSKEAEEEVELLEQKLSELEEAKAWNAYDYIMEDFGLLSELAQEDSVESLAEKIETEAMDNNIVLVDDLEWAIAKRCSELLDRRLEIEEDSVLVDVALKLDDYDHHSYGWTVKTVQEHLEGEADYLDDGEEKADVQAFIGQLKSRQKSSLSPSM